MSKHLDGLGDRIKGYEEAFNYRLPGRMITIARIDGKTFHTMTKKWKCERPFSEPLMMSMSEMTLHLCNNVSGCVMAYTQSDETTLVIRDDMKITTSPFLDKRIQKMCSIIASMSTMSFNSTKHVDVVQHPAMFDCRVFVVPDYEVQNVLLWRQQDAERNSIQMLAQSLYSHKELHKKNSANLQEMCFQKGYNWNSLETWKKRGICFVRNKCDMVNHKGEAFSRTRWFKDMEIPIFTKVTTYVPDHIRNIEDNAD
jgi:tRNA(His) guanylyltransferase